MNAPHMSIGNKLLLAFLVIGGCSSCFNQRDTTTYFVEFDSAMNLSQSSPVIFNGLQVGTVRSIGINNDKIRVELRVQNTFQLRERCQVALVPFDSFGRRAIEIVANEGGKYLAPDTKLKGIVLDKVPIQQLDSSEVHLVVDSVLNLRHR
jgi:ABC-type transporter Mla subunit MlaD